jgi:hypothetical protein
MAVPRENAGVLPMAPVMQTNVNFQIETVPPTASGCRV